MKNNFLKLTLTLTLTLLIGFASCSKDKAKIEKQWTGKLPKELTAKLLETMGMPSIAIIELPILIDICYTKANEVQIGIQHSLISSFAGKPLDTYFKVASTGGIEIKKTTKNSGIIISSEDKESFVYYKNLKKNSVILTIYNIEIPLSAVKNTINMENMPIINF